MSMIRFGSAVSLSTFAKMVSILGPSVAGKKNKHLTLIGRGEMGIGKSAVLGMLTKMQPDKLPAYIDCTLLDLGDFALPYTVEENGIKVTRFAPNARFRFHEGKPVIIMLDEIGKATKAVKNVLLTLMLEHRIGDAFLPEGSIVFATTNLTSEGLGDLLEAHAINRCAEVRILKPDADEWVDNYALPNSLSPTVIAWVKQFPHCLAAADDPSQKDNPYINKLGRGTAQPCVTPRSLEKAAYVAEERAELGDEATMCALAGTIGEAAARDMQAFFTIADKLPTWEQIVHSPNTAKLPEDAVAKCIMVFSAVSRVEKDTLSACLEYVERMDKEWQALFARSMVKSSKQAFCVVNKAFTAWALKNHYLF